MLEPQRHLNETDQAAFTVLELVVVILVASLLMSFAIPHAREIRDVRYRSAARFQVVQHLRWIQAKAVEQGCRGIFDVSETGTSYSLGCDYIPFDESENPVKDLNYGNYPLPKGVSINATEPIVFNTRGQSINPTGTIQTVGVSLSLHSEVFRTGTLRATGFFEYD